MNKNKVKISFVVIGYNNASYLEKCFNSIFFQNSNLNYEVIFVNDGSIDNTDEIANKFMELYDNFVYIRQKNSGANAARIRGFIESKGEYIAFIDGDDYIDKDYISYVLDKLKQYDIDILTFGIDIIENDRIINKKINNDKFYQNDMFLNSILSNSEEPSLCNKVFKRSILIESDFKNISTYSMGEDYLTNIKIGLCEPRVFVSNKCLYNYVVRKDSMTHRPSEKYKELILGAKEVESIVKSRYGNSKDDLINFRYFYLFHYYVVRNKYKYDKIRETIYIEWKKRNCLLNGNKYIEEDIKECSFLEKKYIYIYNNSKVIGCFFNKLIFWFFKLIRRGE
ncbi:TPA: glycosyltransferase family 2 protein [Clostridium perfringens]|nr:glycosyltransferase family 2 protein [Clostridium perfringens]